VMMNRKSLAIYGAGGLGRELKYWVERLPGYAFAGFFDDFVPRGTAVAGSIVQGGISDIGSYTGAEPLNMLVAIGDPATKKKVCDRLSEYRSIVFPVVIHPAAVLDNPGSIQFGEGSIVTAGCVITTDVRVGRHVLINLNCTIGHDSTIGDYSSLMPGVHVSGSVAVGDQVMVGTGASLLNHVSLGERVKVGAGAVVLKSVSRDLTVVGIPAKAIR
jgi:sugar O-acyltransferase (sialic acid O-acetyltransferase NeuD family)